MSPTTFRRLSKRRRTRALVVALLDRLEWGAPQTVSGAMPATRDGMCPACGSPYSVGVDIVLLSYGPADGRVLSWGHETCPDLWSVLDDLRESYDDLIVTRVSHEGRNRASCGHDVSTGPVYLVRRAVSLTDHDHSRWICEECATR